MPLDQNVYALKVSLSFETAMADKALDEFEESISGLEQKVTAAGTKAIASITDVVTTLEKSLVGATTKVEDLDAVSKNLYKNFADTTTVTQDLKTTGDQIYKNLRKLEKIVEKRQKIDEEMIKSAEDMKEFNKKFIEDTNAIALAVKAKNKEHTEQLRLLREESEAAGRVGRNIDNQRAASNAITKIWTTMVSAVRNAISAFDKATEINEQFVELNNRAYGSMRSLSSEVQVLGSNWGVTEKRALEAYKALIAVRTPREDLEKLAGVVARMNRVTGVSAEGIAEYTKRLRGAGLTITQMDAHLGKLAEMQRKYGISVSEMNKHMQNNTVSAATMSVMFDDGGARFQQMQLQFRGLANMWGRDADAISNDLNNMVNDMGQWVLASGALGRPIESADDYAEAIANMGDKLADMEQQWKASRMPSRTLMLNLEAQGKTMGLTSIESIKFAQAIAKVRQELGPGAEGLKDFAAISKKAMEMLPLETRRTMEWKAAMEQLREGFWLVIKPILQMIAEALLPVITVIGWVVKAIAWLVNSFKKLLDIAEQIPVLGWVIWGLKSAIGVLVAIGIGIVMLTTAIGGLVLSLIAIPALTARIGAALTAFGAGIVNLARSIGLAIRAILVQVGRGLQALVGPLTGLALPLLALGGALLMAGAGAYLFAQAVMVMASLPIDEMAARLAILMLAMAAFGLILVGLGGLAMAVWPGLLALGGAILMIGAAAWLFGAGMKMAAEALALIAESAGPAATAMYSLIPIVLMLPLLAGALYISGLMLLSAGIPFVIGATLVGIGALALGYGLQSLGPGAKAFKDVDFIGIAAQLFIGGLMLLSAGAPFILGATLVGIGALLLGYGLRSLGPGAKALEGVNFIGIAAQLFIGGLMLLSAGAPFILGATLVGIGALLLGYGLQSLGPGAKALKDVNFILIAAQLFAGGLMLLSAGIPFVIGATLVGIGALLLGFGLQSLGPGAKTLKGVDFIGIAAQLFIGGLMLLSAGMPFVLGATLVGIGALLLGLGLQALGPGAKALEGVDFVRIAAQLFIGGLMLASAGTVFTFGATLVGYGAVVLGAGLFVLGKGAAAIKDVDFAAIGYKLYEGANNMLAGAYALVSASGTMLLAGYMMLYGAVGLTVASMAMLFAVRILAVTAAAVAPAAILVSIAVMWLSFAFKKLIELGPGLKTTSQALLNLNMGLKEFINFPAMFGSAASEFSQHLDTFSATLTKFDKVLSTGVIDNAVEKFRKPADQLIEILQNLSSTIAGFDGIGVGLESNLQALSTVLEAYAVRLEGVSERLQTAVDAKVMPALRMAEQAGITEAVRSEAVSKVEVMPPAEEGNDEQERTNNLLTEQNSILLSLLESVNAVSAAGRTAEFTEIVELLRTYMPQMAAETRLAAELNEWDR